MDTSQEGTMDSSYAAFSGRYLDKETYPKAKKGGGKYIYSQNGQKVFDAAGGAAVSCIGHRDLRVEFALSKYSFLHKLPSYLASTVWLSDPVLDLSNKLAKSTKNNLAHIYLTNSGSQATETAIKLARQFFYEQDKETPRVKFISREGSYHGNTLAALSLSGFPARRKPYEPYLNKSLFHKVSSCNPYRQRRDGESDADFVERKARELDDKFEELGPNSVIAFVAEPVVGAALGCVPCVKGYLKAMKDICHKHGALLILDEVMCGMGRTGTLHTWLAEDVVPDIQTVGKGLAGGYEPAAAVLISPRIMDVLKKGSGGFNHGFTFDFYPKAAVAALKVMNIIQEEDLLRNVREQGDYLEKELKRLLNDHPNVGDIRGRGLFWGIEFVKDKESKEPFPEELKVAGRIKDLAFNPPFSITVYPSAGNNDGVHGDRIILAPPLNITKKDVDLIVHRVCGVISQFFSVNL